MLTNEEAVSKYGNVALSFCDYWKFQFTFKGVADDGAEVRMCVGGCSEDIYRLSVSDASEHKLADSEYTWAAIYLGGAKIWQHTP